MYPSMRDKKESLCSYVFRLLALAVIALYLTGCYRQDVVTIEVKIPQLKSPQCADIIQKSLEKYNTPKLIIIKSIQFDYTTKSAKITYDAGQTAVRNIQHWIAESGFQADSIAPFPGTRERLPKECQ